MFINNILYIIIYKLKLRKLGENKNFHNIFSLLIKNLRKILKLSRFHHHR